MDLKDFVKNVLIDLNAAVDEARGAANRDIKFTENERQRTIEFDIAVTAQEKDATSGKAGVKVLGIVEGGGQLSKEMTNSVVSRVAFGLTINHLTKQEQANENAIFENRQETLRSNFTV